MDDSLHYQAKQKRALDQTFRHIYLSYYVEPCKTAKIIPV